MRDRPRSAAPAATAPAAAAPSATVASLEPAVRVAFAHRATALLAAACRRGSRGHVLLPALYCADVAAAVAATGLEVRCYDLPEDLSPPGEVLADAVGADTAAVVTFHPFGLYRPVPREAFDAPGAGRDRRVVVEDGCHALRTLWLRGDGTGADLTVFSAVKELAWVAGGVARGRHAAAVAREAVRDFTASGLPGRRRPGAGAEEGFSPDGSRGGEGSDARSPGGSAEGVAATDLLPALRDGDDPARTADAVARRWRRLDLSARIESGRRVTALVREALDDRLPPGGGDEVLFALPLLSRQRDRVIDRLRGEGYGAWRWLRPVPGSGPRTTPRAWRLRRRLLLVPLPPSPGPLLDRLLDRVAAEPLEPWRGR